MAITFTDNTGTISTTEFSLPNNSTTLTPQTTKGVMQAYIDVNAVAAGDQYQVHILERLNAGTQRVVYEAILTGVQSPPIFVTPALMVGDGWDVTMKSLLGTARAIVWSIRQSS